MTPKHRPARALDDWRRAGSFPVAEGVYRTPLPLPGDALSAVNVYVIEGPDGVTLIDAGWAIERARLVLEEGLARIGRDLGEVVRVLVTHVHRDHYELTLLLRKLFGSRIALGIGERPVLDAIIGAQREIVGPGMRERLWLGGAQEILEHIDVLVADEDEAPSVRTIEWDYPDEWLRDGELITIGDRRLEVMATPGHTRGHVVFMDRASGLIFAGDHVLPHITPSIGFEPLPVDDSLWHYLESLARLRCIPDARLLPAHGPVQGSTHARVRELEAHHETRLEQCARSVAAGNSTAYEVAQSVPWTRRDKAFHDLDPFNQMLAVNETLAHLDVLVWRGEADMRQDGPARRYS